MVNRRVCAHGRDGVVTRWEPLGSGMTDTLVCHDDDGSECWYASHTLTPIDDDGPLPTREEAQDYAARTSLRQLTQIRAQHVEDFRKPWHGAEFGKALFGRALDRAIENVKKGRG